MKATPNSMSDLCARAGTRTFSGPNLLQIAMPLGGIGAGCVCLNGHGGLQDFSIRHQPDTSAMPDGHLDRDAAFALLRMKTSSQDVTRLVEGPMPVEKIYNQGLKGQGFRGGGFEGLPRFRNCSFQGEYPFGLVNLSDPNLPLAVEITGWSPFIPLDDRDSSLPCAVLEYRLKNTTVDAVEFAFSYHLSHLAPGDPAYQGNHSRNELIEQEGIFFYNVEPAQSPAFGSAALMVLGDEVKPDLKAMWYRGGWFDAISALWREISEGRFESNDGATAAQMFGRNGGSIQVSGRLRPGESVLIPVAVVWHFPNVPWGVGLASSQADCDCLPGESCSPCWRPYYAGQWEDARSVALYLRGHYTDLRQRTQAFHDALFSSSLPSIVLDAVSANLAILKSPTVLRQENGNVWGWEGCFCDRGCCHGTCTHVWNYAQAMAHLFPALERGLRELELARSMNEEGHITFRAALPDGPTKHDYHAASDGQLGGVMKVYREWQISGDHAWLEKMYPLVKHSMHFCIEHWDPDHSGLIMEPHHNTYDIEFWGPDGMISSFYLGALGAMAQMAREIEGEDAARPYDELAQKGAKAIESLFNGEYYEQRVTWEGLHDTSFAEKMAQIGPDSTSEDRLLKQEGPKYQYGSGCLSDGVLGAWLARRCGIESLQNQQHVRRSLAAIFAYNFRESLWEHANSQRPGYAMGDEAGLLLCTWPHGGKPTFPFPYSDEVWTGYEYQAASHMIEMGLAAEGLTIVQAARGRYEGHVRNPWNEYECGNYYARAMSSYALLEACTGLKYSAVTGVLRVEPRLDHDSLVTFFSTAFGWGSLTLDNDLVVIDLCEGELVLKEIVVVRDGKPATASLGVTARAGEPLRVSVG